jgi:hypothetical protein
MSDVVKARLLALIAERQTDLATVSKAIGKNHAYLGQFIRRNVPRRLPEEVRESLGRHFGVDPDIFRNGPASASIYRNGARLDPGKLRRAMMVAEKVVGSRALEDRGAVVVEIASAVYDVLAEKEAEGRPIDDDDDGLRAIEAILRRIHQPRGG